MGKVRDGLAGVAGMIVDGAATVTAKAQKALDKDGDGTVDAEDIKQSATEGVEKAKEGLGAVAGKIGGFFDGLAKDAQKDVEESADKRPAEKR